MPIPARADAVVQAVHQWLTDSSDGLNAQLALLRARYSPALSSGQLPDVATFDQWTHRTSEGRSIKAPYLSIVLTGITPELEPNSRFFDHTVQITIVVLDRDIQGAMPDAAQAAWRHYDGLVQLHTLRNSSATPGKPTGVTLFNGGTVATGRVIHSSLGSARLVKDAAVDAGNFAIRSILTVRLAEDY